MKLILDTTNSSKLNQMCRYAAPLQLECLSPAELGLDAVSIPEDENTPGGNAVQNAKIWQRFTHLPVLTEDSGMVLPDLPLNHSDQPGLHVRRVDGVSLDDAGMLTAYCALSRRHGGRLLAAYQQAWCFLDEQGNVHLHEDSLEALHHKAFWLVDTPCAERHPGWRLDSISVHQSTGRYFAQMQAVDFSVDDNSKVFDVSVWLQSLLMNTDKA